MKKFLGTRIGVIILTMVVCIIAFSGVAYAAGVFDKDLPISGIVVASNAGLELYADQACTIPLSTWDLSNIYQNNTVTKWVYAKNIGNRAFTSISLTETIDPAVGTITSTSLPVNGLSVGSVDDILLTVTINETGTVGAFSANVKLSGTY